jgi:hypothetical protein
VVSAPRHAWPLSGLQLFVDKVHSVAPGMDAHASGSDRPMPQKHNADRRRHNKKGRDNQPQVIIALAVTCDGMPVRSWVLPSDTADVATVLAGVRPGRSFRVASPSLECGLSPAWLPVMP